MGDLHGWMYDEKTKAQNYKDGREPDGRASILRVSQNGETVGEGILGKYLSIKLILCIMN